MSFDLVLVVHNTLTVWYVLVYKNCDAKLVILSLSNAHRDLIFFTFSNKICFLSLHR